MFTYKPLRHLMVDKGLDNTYLYTDVGITWPTISKLKNDEPVRMDILVKLCQHFKVQMNEIVEIKIEDRQ